MRFRVFAFAAAFMAMSVSASAYRTSVWIAPWEQSSLTSVQINGAHISESNPVWYSMNADGSIAKNGNAENPTWRAAMVGSELIPTIQNVVASRFNGSTVVNLLSSPATRESHAEAIAQLVIQNAFDGIDIDYERVPTASRAQFTDFINVLAAKLHRVGKKLSVTVYPKLSDKQNWDGPGSQDWGAIGAVADLVKIMVYDFHWSTSEAGSITPLTWLDGVTTYAESVMASQKVMIGLPWYGYDWVASKGTPIDYTSAMALIRTTGATVSRDAEGEVTFTYAGGHVVYFQDAESYSKKIDVLVQKHPSIGGFAHWRSGNEDPATWQRVAALKNGSTAPVATPATTAPAPPTSAPTTPAPPTTPGPPTGGGTTQPPSGSGAAPVTGDFAVSGPATLAVTAGGLAAAEYGVIAINGFASNVNVSVEKVSSFRGDVVLNASTISPSSRATLSMNVERGTVAGDYQLRLRFVSGTRQHEQMVTVQVKAAATTPPRHAVIV
ncbi:MAG TPA: glycosyl hydrolase family 18 protein [Thermoanaerobaculia bacterium]|nr:glycosyl hydrolase family 18 protein [Thermoanaerobaculia bacterium]